MPQNELTLLMKKLNDYKTCKELSIIIKQSPPSVRRMLRRMYQYGEVERKIVCRFKRQMFAYKLKM